jgi:hypothetical protein
MMPVSRPRLLAVAAALALFAAHAVTVAAPLPGSILSMTERQSIVVAPGAILTYDSVNDSRCPPDVQCLVAGKVVYSFTLKRGDTLEHFTLSPAEPAFKSAVLNGQRVTLAGNAPPPRARQAGATHPVSVKVVAP